MPVTGLGLGPGQDRLSKKTLRHSTDSDELDVFEASRYFSGEPSAPTTGGNYWNRVSSGTSAGAGGRRISLDMPSMRNHHRQSLFSSSQHHHHHAAADQKQSTLKQSTHKQPSSPGGRIASFLNSLFTQSAAKKKKPKPSGGGGAADDGRRKRRSSISHFPTNPDQNDAVFAQIPNLRTPPPATLAVVTPTKTALRSLSDHKTKNPDQKLKLRDNSTTIVNNNNNRYRESVNFEDDGAESDSSSDLFELRNYDLGDYELPVYETTHMESVGAPISVHGR